MTAEIAVMNREAVALAADSAVTLATAGGQKIYASALKLFQLSHHQPVGIMVYGGAALMGIPWETLVKLYRRKLGTECFPTLRDYVVDFVRFLDAGASFFPQDQRRAHVAETIHSVYSQIADIILKRISDHIGQHGHVTDADIEQFATEEIRASLEAWRATPPLEHGGQSDAHEVIWRHSDLIARHRRLVFEALPLPPTAVTDLTELVGLVFTRNWFADNSSGIVIAGYGEEEFFPHLMRLRFEGFAGSLLKHALDDEVAVTVDHNAWLVPFAQREMVDTFMEGTTPGYQQSLEEQFDTVLETYSDQVVRSLVTAPAQVLAVQQALTPVRASIMSRLTQELQQQRRRVVTNPVLDAVAMLPKDELAAMAESLVNLTSFKRKVSLDAETVGGPIDVAVISKGDGFVWIKRKHYFDPELNPQFFMRYR